MTTTNRFNECPNCGSDGYRNVAPESAHFVYDRICRDCETRYTPPTPSWMAVVGTCSGLAILAIIFSYATFALLQGPPGVVDSRFIVQILIVIVIPIAAAILAGARHFRKRKGNNE